MRLIYTRWGYYVSDLPKIVKRQRKNLGLTQRQLAEAVRVSTTQIAQIEQGKMVPQPDNAARMDDVLGTGGEIIKAADTAREDRQPWLRPWVEHERRALLVRTWEPLLIPGLLQTEAYMRAVFSAVPRNAGRIDALIAARRERQASTIHREEGPVALSAIVGEVVLRRGPGDILKDQLGHLVNLGHHPHIKIRIVPAESEGIHVGLSGPFNLATMPDGRRVGQMDDQLIGHSVTSHSDLGHLELAWEEVDSLALPLAQSRDVILRMLNDHK